MVAVETNLWQTFLDAEQLEAIEAIRPLSSSKGFPEGEILLY
jgi:hypothetical protein